MTEKEIIDELNKDDEIKILHRPNSTEYKIGNGLIPFGINVFHRDHGYPGQIEYGYMDLNGKIQIPTSLTYASGFDNGYAVVKFPNAQQYAIIDTKGLVVMDLPQFFSGARNMIDYYIPVCNNLEDNKWGLVKFHPENKSIELIMPFVWDYMEDAIHGFPHVGLYQDKPAISENERNWQWLKPKPEVKTFLYHLSHEDHEKMFNEPINKEQFLFLMKYGKEYINIEAFNSLEADKRSARERIRLGYSIHDNTEYLKEDDIPHNKQLKM